MTLLLLDKVISKHKNKLTARTYFVHIGNLPNKSPFFVPTFSSVGLSQDFSNFFGILAPPHEAIPPGLLIFLNSRKGGLKKITCNF